MKDKFRYRVELRADGPTFVVAVLMLEELEEGTTVAKRRDKAVRENTFEVTDKLEQNIDKWVKNVINSLPPETSYEFIERVGSSSYVEKEQA